MNALIHLFHDTETSAEYVRNLQAIFVHDIAYVQRERRFTVNSWNTRDKGEI